MFLLYDYEDTSQVENTGVQLIRQASAKTNDVAGDGTTTATILAQCMVKSGMKQLVGGANPVQIKLGMEKAATYVVEKIKESAVAVSESDMKKIEQAMKWLEGLRVLLALCIIYMRNSNLYLHLHIECIQYTVYTVYRRQYL